MDFRPPRRLLLAGLLAVACYSPTLPLPPPVRPEITETETGGFRITGSVLPNAQVFALNERNRRIDGQEVGSDGIYSFELTLAERGDLVQLWYLAGTELSPTTVFELPTEADAGEGGAGGAGP
jgi:hypothetical protein